MIAFHAIAIKQTAKIDSQVSHPSFLKQNPVNVKAFGVHANENVVF